MINDQLSLIIDHEDHEDHEKLHFSKEMKSKSNLEENMLWALVTRKLLRQRLMKLEKIDENGQDLMKMELEKRKKYCSKTCFGHLRSGSYYVIGWWNWIKWMKIDIKSCQMEKMDMIWWKWNWKTVNSIEAKHALGTRDQEATMSKVDEIG